MSFTYARYRASRKARANNEKLIHYYTTYILNTTITSGKYVHKKYTPSYPNIYSNIWACRGIPIFLIFAQKIDSGYSLEPRRRGGSNVFPQSMFSKYQNVSDEIFFFAAEIIHCIFHR